MLPSSQGGKLSGGGRGGGDRGRRGHCSRDQYSGKIELSSHSGFCSQKK